MIRTEKITHRFKSGFQLLPCTLEFQNHECIAVLGKNGAGKSTFFQLLTGFLPPLSGKVWFNEKLMAPRNSALRKNIGYLTQKLPLPDWSTPIQLLRYVSKLHQLGNSEDKIRSILEQWECTSFQNQPIHGFSHGMKKRVGLCVATLHQPNFLILDEPYSGLDLSQNQNLSKFISNRTKRNQTILLSTHIIPYAAELCDRAIFVDNGNIQEISKWKSWDFQTRMTRIKEMVENS